MSSRMPLPGALREPRDPQRKDYDGYVHYEQCPIGAPDPAAIQWVCDEGHWLATDIPPGAGDQCPVVLHQADADDSRCVGTLSRPECICEEANGR